MLPDGDYLNLQVTYAAPPISTGHMALMEAHKFWNHSENSSGEYAQLGFLYLYELLTGTKKVKILDTDCSRTFATLMFELLSDKSEAAFLPSILNIMCRYSYLLDRMPKYKDNRKFKNSTILASDVSEESSGGESMGPLGSVLSGCMAVLQNEIYNLMTISTVNHINIFPVPSDEAVEVSVVPIDSVQKDRLWIVPQISNYSCKDRILGVLSSEKNGENDIPTYLLLSHEDLDSFVTQPLKSVQFNEFIVTIEPQNDSNYCNISTKLPFNVSSHHMANTTIAKSMINRLEIDTCEYANIVNHHLKSQFIVVTNLNKVLSNSNASKDLSDDLNTNKLIIVALIRKLEELRTRDVSYVSSSLIYLIKKINTIDLTNYESNFVYSLKKQIFYLKRLSGQETFIWLEYLFATILSSNQFNDLIQLNPFLSEIDISSMNYVISATILHANRVGQINRCLLDLRYIQKNLLKLEKMCHKNDSIRVSDIKSLWHDITLKSDNLINNLKMSRYYMDILENSVVNVATEGEGKRRRTDNLSVHYDPRFLLFEFTWNILLRKVQIEMVREYVSDIQNGRSSVKQMIMGAGKTTVVCPLLTLILSDGDSLVVQVVPPALLEFSRSIMRSTFSSIMHKRIFTLQFDRSTEITSNMFTKLLQSRNSRGVVITTPTTVKSIMLKFLETMEVMRIPNEKLRQTSINKDCQVRSDNA